MSNHESLINVAQAGAGATATDGGGIRAILFGMDAARAIDLDAEDPTADIVRLVGDPLIDCGHVLRSVMFWVGDTSAFTARFNLLASWHLSRLLGDVDTGAYPVDVTERAHARRRVRADNVPSVFGECLITGSTLDGDLTALDDTFLTWFENLRASSSPQPNEPR